MYTKKKEIDNNVIKLIYFQSTSFFPCGALNIKWIHCTSTLSMSTSLLCMFCLFAIYLMRSSVIYEIVSTHTQKHIVYMPQFMSHLSGQVFHIGSILFCAVLIRYRNSFIYLLPYRTHKMYDVQISISFYMDCISIFVDFFFFFKVAQFRN